MGDNERGVVGGMIGKGNLPQYHKSHKTWPKFEITSD
jgi:hypothetical protein